MKDSHAASDEIVEITDADLAPVDEFRREHDTAVLAIMFTDLKGSTALAEHHGEAVAERIRREHERLVSDVVTRGNAGTIVKTIGDAALCVFAEPTAAVERALEIQDRSQRRLIEGPDHPPLEIRIGIHMGQAAVDDAVRLDVFGRHVNRAKRIEELAGGGQILMTFPVYDSARGWLATQGVEWADHGWRRLKGIAEKVRVYEACRPGHRPRRPPGRPRARLAAAIIASLLATITAVAFAINMSSSPTKKIVVTPAVEVPNPDLDRLDDQ